MMHSFAKQLQLPPCNFCYAFGSLPYKQLSVNRATLATPYNHVEEREGNTTSFWQQARKGRSSIS